MSITMTTKQLIAELGDAVSDEMPYTLEDGQYIGRDGEPFEMSPRFMKHRKVEDDEAYKRYAELWVAGRVWAFEAVDTEYLTTALVHATIIDAYNYAFDKIDTTIDSAANVRITLVTRIVYKMGHTLDKMTYYRGDVWPELDAIKWAVDTMVNTMLTAMAGSY